MNEPSVRSFNGAAPLRAGDAIFYINSLTENRFESALLFWPDEFCEWVGCFFVISPIDLVASRTSHFDQPYFTFDFQLNMFFQITIQYYILAYSLSLL